MVTAQQQAETPAARAMRFRTAAAQAIARKQAAALRLARRPDVQFVGALLLAVFAARFSLRHTAGLNEDVAVFLAVAATLPLTLARIAPLASLATAIAASSVFIIGARLAWPAAAILAWLISLALSPSLLRRRQAVTLLVAAQTAVIAALFVPARINATPWDATVAESVAALAAWWIGENLRARKEVKVERAQTAQRLHALAQQDAVARERARIARELHDVVAHHVSTIAVRAATLPYEVADMPPPVRSALSEIAEGARAALVDLRAVLGVLRNGDEAIEGAPQPRLADVPTLIARVQTTGTQVLLRIDGQERSLSDGLEVCGYRIVQEALTNTVRHAPGSKVEVDVEYRADALTIRVRDNGLGQPTTAENGEGFGLVGMRERVTMLGGSLCAGPRPGGGFEVVAKLPCAYPAASGGEERTA
ncbi:MAG TPA: sensor histidine kinase [Actinocrinis sp.]|nr:sensor histidine kinase [Actinocrinis sp.]